MGYENDPYRDEDGEPLIDLDDDRQSDLERKQFIEGEDAALYVRHERSPTPVYNESKSKPRRKRLAKKSSAGKDSSSVDFQFDYDSDGAGDDDQARDAYSDSGKRKREKGARKFDYDSDGAGDDDQARDAYSDRGKRKREKGVKRKRVEKKGKAEKRIKVSRSGGRTRDHEANPEMKEMWETVAGGTSKDDQAGVRNVDDDNFIDDSGLNPADRYGSGNEQSPSRAPQAEEGGEDDEIEELFKVGKRKKKKTEKSAEEIALHVERVMAELEVAAEEDAELNRQSKPAINKLKKLSLLTDVLSKKHLQPEFLDHGILTVLKNWLEPLPDGSLPNRNVRAAVLKTLNDFPIDLERYDRREQLKKSRLGRVIKFLSKSDEETAANRKLAKELVDKWSRIIFNKSTRLEDAKNSEDERVPRRPPVKKGTSKAAGTTSRDDDRDEFSRGTKSGESSSSRRRASRPEAVSMDFVVRPQSKVDPDQVRARAKQTAKDGRRAKINKTLQRLRAPKRKQLQATKPSAEGRGMT